MMKSFDTLKSAGVAAIVGIIASVFATSASATTLVFDITTTSCSNGSCPSATYQQSWTIGPVTYEDSADLHRGRANMTTSGGPNETALLDISNFDASQLTRTLTIEDSFRPGVFIFPATSSWSFELNTFATIQFAPTGLTDPVTNDPLFRTQRYSERLRYSEGTRFASGPYNLARFVDEIVGKTLSYEGRAEDITGPSFLFGSGTSFGESAVFSGTAMLNLVASGLAPGASGVPEPAGWALMILGFGVVGGALRNRRRTRVTIGSY